MYGNNDAERYRKTVAEQMLIRGAFPSFSLRIKGKELTCRGRIRPSEHSKNYRVEIRYRPWSPPQVRILDPEVPFTPGAHMYKDGTLCLYDSREQRWENNWHLHQTIVPWTAEWLVFYELFQLSGKWLGKSAVHAPEGPRSLG